MGTRTRQSHARWVRPGSATAKPGYALAKPGRAAFCLLCASCALGGGIVRAQTYSNPLDIHSSGFGADGPADPCVVEYLGTYYIYPTGNSVDYLVMLSEDLVHWRGGAGVFAIPPGSPWKDGGLWAPEIQRINGRFYLYYTAGNSSGQHIGVADSDTPTGPFTDRNFDAPLISAASIDACCLVDGANLYLYYVRGGTVWVRKLRDPLTVDTTVAARQCIIPDVPWEATVNEGPYVFKRGDLYYMLYSGNYADGPDYGVGAAWATSPRGPWTKQADPYNPIFQRNDAIQLWGPGHGSPLIGPDGVSDWYAYHHKTESAVNWHRLLALDRIVSAPRVAAPGLVWLSSGGTTGPTPAPRRAFSFSNFDAAQLPAGFHVDAGAWAVQDGALSAPQDGALRIDRPLALGDLQNFQCEWWIQAGGPPSGDSAFVEFSFEGDLNGRPARLGFQIRPALHAIQFVGVILETGQATVLAAAPVDPSLDWAAYYRRITVSKCGTRWSFLIDRQPLLTAEHAASLQHQAWVRTSGLPLLLDGYRQTLVFADDFECPTCTSGAWTQLSGTWTVVPDSSGGHVERQSDVSGGFKISLCNGPALEQFDLGADFHMLSQTTGPGLFPKHGLIHNYTDPANYAMIFIDDQYNVLASSAVINGVFQDWINAPGPMPATFTGGEFRHLDVTTDADSGEFVYSLDGHEMLRRAYAGLPAGGLAGLITELSDVEVDNFRFSGSAPRTVAPDFDGDGDVDQSDFGHFQACLTASGAPPDLTCGDADLNSDSKIDALDFAVFERCLSGETIMAPAHCAD